MSAGRDDRRLPSAVARRQIVSALVGAIGAAACGGAQKTLRARGLVEPSPFSLDPIVDLVPAAGLNWLIAARPKEVFARPAPGGLLGAVAPAEWIDVFCQKHGVDLRQADQLVVAGYDNATHATLALARVPVDPRRVEAAFAARAAVVEGRAVDRGVTRFWGNVRDEREQVAVFGYEGIGIERGALGPLRAAVYFSQGRLTRSYPALRAEPLLGAAARLGSGPLLAFVPGPFEGEWGAGLGRLLGASTAFAVGLQALPAGGPSALALRIVLTGAWGDDAPHAAEHFAATFRVLAEAPWGRLTGLDRPLKGPTPTAAPDAIALDVRLDAVRMVAGVRAATVAPVAEIMAF